MYGHLTKSRPDATAVRAPTRFSHLGKGAPVLLGLWLLVEIAATAWVSSHDGVLSDLFQVVQPTPVCAPTALEPGVPKPAVSLERRPSGTNGWVINASHTVCVVVSFHRPAGFSGHAKFVHASVATALGEMQPYAQGELYTTSGRGGRYTLTATGPGGTTTTKGRIPVNALSPWESLWRTLT